MKNIKNKKNKPVWQAPEENQPCCPYCGSTDIEPNNIFVIRATSNLTKMMQDRLHSQEALF